LPLQQIELRSNLSPCLPIASQLEYSSLNRLKHFLGQHDLLESFSQKFGASLMGLFCSLEGFERVLLEVFDFDSLFESPREREGAP